MKFRTDQEVTIILQVNETIGIRVNDISVRLSKVDECIRKIIVDYHRAHLKEFDLIQGLIEDVEKANSFSKPFLLELKHLVLGTIDELAKHMQKEEDVLFPYISLLQRNLEKGLSRNPRMSIKTLICEYESDHQDLDFLVPGIRQMIMNYDEVNEAQDLSDRLIKL